MKVILTSKNEKLALGERGSGLWKVFAKIKKLYRRTIEKYYHGLEKRGFGEIKRKVKKSPRSKSASAKNKGLDHQNRDHKSAIGILKNRL